MPGWSLQTSLLKKTGPPGLNTKEKYRIVRNEIDFFTVTGDGGGVLDDIYRRKNGSGCAPSPADIPPAAVADC